ncbi:SRPBCC domain-containing protein, partial [Candidatus Saccharibacteria bacterium]|nr:SRPBCC domain-containing protein [Candidatus Saccharibacteria bacterium]
SSWGVMQIKEVNEGKSFTYQDFFSDEDGVLDMNMPALIVTNEFIEEDGKTRIISTSLADNPAQIEELIKMGMIEGFSSQLDKLDKLFA